MIGEQLIKKINLKRMKFNYQLDRYPSAFDRNKCIFFHIPKAAGTSVCLSLFGCQTGHLNFNSLYNSNPQKASTYFKFTFVRNPWSRLVSAYHFLQAGGMYESDKVWADNNIKAYSEFSDFVYKWVNQENVNSFTHFIPQHKFISDENGVIRADFVGKTENIQKDFQVVSSILGLDAKLQHSNKSNHNSYVDYYDNRTKAIVASVYEKDINLFGYEFGK